MAVNPFEGDFGSPGDRILRDKITVARKTYQCGMCRQQIQPGEKTRVLAAVFDGELRAYRWCAPCCAAMASSWTDDGDAWESRVAIGNATRHEAPQ